MPGDFFFPNHIAKIDIFSVILFDEFLIGDLINGRFDLKLDHNPDLDVTFSDLAAVSCYIG